MTIWAKAQCTICGQPIFADDLVVLSSETVARATVHLACLETPVEHWASDIAIRTYRERRPDVALPEPFASMYGGGR